MNQQDRTILSFGEAGRAALALIDRLTVQRDAAEALAREVSERESTLGLQVVAQAARLRLADALAENARDAVVICWRDLRHGPLTVALAAWDAVPGDVGVKAPATDARLVGPDGEPER